MSSEDEHRTEKLLHETSGTVVVDMVFDTIDRVLYWTGATEDRQNGTIYKLRVDDESAEPIPISVHASLPCGIAIDKRQRQLYWTNEHVTDPSVERIPLDGSQISEVLVNPTEAFDILVDQFTKRLYWSHSAEINETKYYSI